MSESDEEIELRKTLKLYIDFQLEILQPHFLIWKIWQIGIAVQLLVKKLSTWPTQRQNFPAKFLMLTLFLAITEDQLEQLRDARDIDRIMVSDDNLFVKFN